MGIWSPFENENVFSDVPSIGSSYVSMIRWSGPTRLGSRAPLAARRLHRGIGRHAPCYETR
jgi:hypothetical protein